MTTEEDFFDGIGGSGAPSALLKNPGDYVHGEIVDMHRKPYIPFGKKEPEKDERTGQDKQQLVIILQTAFRNWQGVTKVPVKDPSDPQSPVKDPTEDDGKRAIYVPQGKNIQFAVGRALTAAGAKPQVGGTLGVRVVKLTPTDKGNPLKEHEAVYAPPSAGAGFFPGEATQQAPAAPPAQTPPPAAPPVQEAAPAQQDPWWATPAQSAPATEAPPF